MFDTTYSYEEMQREAKREARKLIKTHINRKLSADNIQESTPIWYFAQSVITAVNEDKS